MMKSECSAETSITHQWLHGYIEWSLNYMMCQYILAWIAGNIARVTKNTKKTLNNCGKACLKIFQ